MPLRSLTSCVKSSSVCTTYPTKGYLLTCLNNEAGHHFEIMAQTVAPSMQYLVAHSSHPKVDEPHPEEPINFAEFGFEVDDQLKTNPSRRWADQCSNNAEHIGDAGEDAQSKENDRTSLMLVEDENVNPLAFIGNGSDYGEIDYLFENLQDIVTILGINIEG